MMAADTLEALGIERGEYVIKVNNRKVLDGVMEAIGLGGEENAGRRLTVLRAIDKLDRLGPEGVRALLGEGRRTRAAISRRVQGSIAQDAIMRVIGSTLCAASVRRLRTTSLRHRSSRAWTIVETRLSATGTESGRSKSSANGSTCSSRPAMATDRIRIDPSVVRGLEYYTGPVFEAELTFDVRGDDGHPVRFGSVGGGGRYDGLVARFRGEPVPATGFSIGVSRLLSALKRDRQPDRRGGRTARPGRRARDGPATRSPTTSASSRGCGAAGIAAELYLGAAGMNAQLKYADRAAPSAPSSRARTSAMPPGGRQVTIRDLVLGAELAAASKDRADYLELRQRAQFPVAEELLVAGGERSARPLHALIGSREEVRWQRSGTSRSGAWSPATTRTTSPR